MDTPNLFVVGRTAEGDREAGASLRVTGTAFTTGHAAGVAASCYPGQGRTDTGAVHRILREQGALLDQADMAALAAGVARSADPP